MSLLGILGDILLVLGVWQMGNRKRFAHLITVVGEVLWIIKAYQDQQWELAGICILFAVLAGRTWVKWGEK